MNNNVTFLVDLLRVASVEAITISVNDPDIINCLGRFQVWWAVENHCTWLLTYQLAHTLSPSVTLESLADELLSKVSGVAQIFKASNQLNIAEDVQGAMNEVKRAVEQLLRQGAKE